MIRHPFLVANRLVPGSYVSGLAALAFAGAIPEFVPEVTSCGPGRPHVRTTPLGRFSFRYLKAGLSDPSWPSPNLELLNAAVRQGAPEAEPLAENTWREVVAERVKGLPWDEVVADVRPFLQGSGQVVGKGEVLGLLG